MQMFGWKPCPPVHWSWKKENIVKGERKLRAGERVKTSVPQVQVALPPGGITF